MIKNFSALILVLIAGSYAIAGLPPTTIKGQGDSAVSTKFNFQVPNKQYTNLGGTTALIETGNQNRLTDPGFEAATDAAWTESGGTFSQTTTAGDIGEGVKAGSWDSNGAAQTLTSTSVTISSGDGLSGSPGAASCRFKCDSGTCTHKIQAYDGTNVLAEDTITSTTDSFSRTSVSFSFPASGTASLRIVSVAADEPTLFVDQCYLGLAEGFNIHIGMAGSEWEDWSSRFTVTGAGTVTNLKIMARRVGDSVHLRGGWTNGTATTSVSSLNFTGFSIDSDRIRSATSGTRVGSATASSNSTSANIFSADFERVVFYDGSTTDKVFFAYQVGSSGYTKGLGNSVWINGGESSIDISLPVEGWSSGVTSHTFDTTAASWSGYHDGISAGCSVTSSTFGDTSACTDIVLQELDSQNITCTTAASSLPGITCTFPRAGKYKVCANPNLITSNGNNMSVRLVDGSANIIVPGIPFSMSGVADNETPTLCGPFTATSKGPHTFKLQAAVNTNTGYVGFMSGQSFPSGTSQIRWDVMAIDQSFPAPVVNNSVTSTYQGSQRIERVKVASQCTSTPCTVANQSGAISSVSRASTGLYTVNFSAGTFSDDPTCIVQQGQGDKFSIRANEAGAATSTSWNFGAHASDTGTATDIAFEAICMGPR